MKGSGDHSDFFWSSCSFSAFVMRNLGPFQFQSPSRCITAGTMYVLTISASHRMAKQRANPNC